MSALSSLPFQPSYTIIFAREGHASNVLLELPEATVTALSKLQNPLSQKNNSLSQYKQVLHQDVASLQERLKNLKKSILDLKKSTDSLQQERVNKKAQLKQLKTEAIDVNWRLYRQEKRYQACLESIKETFFIMLETPIEKFHQQRLKDIAKLKSELPFLKLRKQELEAQVAEKKQLLQQKLSSSKTAITSISIS